VLFIVLTGLSPPSSFHVWPNIRDHIQIGDNEDWGRLGWGNAYNYSDELSKEFPLAERCASTTSAVRSTSTWRMISHMLKVSSASGFARKSREMPTATTPRPNLIFSINDQIVTLNANSQGAADKSVVTDMDVYVPERRNWLSRTGVATLTSLE